MLVAIWHILTNECDYADLGANWFDRRTDNERLGYKVTVEPAAA